MPALTQPRWKRVVLKLSGEALAEKTGFGLDNDVLAQLAGELREAREVLMPWATVGANACAGQSSKMLRWCACLWPKASR